MKYRSCILSDRSTVIITDIQVSCLGSIPFTSQHDFFEVEGGSVHTQFRRCSMADIPCLQFDGMLLNANLNVIDQNLQIEIPRVTDYILYAHSAYRRGGGLMDSLSEFYGENRWIESTDSMRY